MVQTSRIVIPLKLSRAVEKSIYVVETSAWILKWWTKISNYLLRNIKKVSHPKTIQRTLKDNDFDNRTHRNKPLNAE